MAPRLRLLCLAVALSAVAVNLPRLESEALASGLDAKGEAMAKEASGLYRQGLYEDAAKLFAKLVVDYPDMLIFERSLGACFYYLRKPEPALSNLRNYLGHRQDIPADDKVVVDRWIAEMEKLRAQNAPTFGAPALTVESSPALLPQREGSLVSPPTEPREVTSPAPNPQVALSSQTPPPNSPAQPDVPTKRTEEVLAENAAEPTAETLAALTAPTRSSPERFHPQPVPPYSTQRKSRSGGTKDLWRATEIVSAGVGGGALAAGIILGLVARSRNQSALDRCPQAPCNDSAKALQSEARDYAKGANIAFIAGGTLVLSGVILYLVAPADQSSSQNQARLLPFAGPGSLGLVTGGTW